MERKNRGVLLWNGTIFLASVRTKFDALSFSCIKRSFQKFPWNQTVYMYEPAPAKARVFDLEDRMFLFADNVRDLVKALPQCRSNEEDGGQVIRSSGSVGANYIEANQSLGDKDFLMRARIARKEARESRFWLKLLDTNNNIALENQRLALAKEADELTRILGAMIRNTLQKRSEP